MSLGKAVVPAPRPSVGGQWQDGLEGFTLSGGLGTLTVMLRVWTQGLRMRNEKRVGKIRQEALLAPGLRIVI